MFNTKYIGILFIAALGSGGIYLIVPEKARQIHDRAGDILTTAVIETRLSSTPAQVFKGGTDQAIMSASGLQLEKLASRAIEQGSGRKLVTLLALFWRDCEAGASCEQDLLEQKRQLSPERYALLEHFIHNGLAREELLGLELVSQNASLEQKIAQVKYIDRQVWGDDAELLFADEYALYQFSLKSRQLSELEDAAGFIDAYQELLRQQHDDLARFSLESDLAKYEHASALIPDAYSAYDRAFLTQALADKYLLPVQQASLLLRQEQVTHQAIEVQTYRQGFDALSRELMASRQTDRAHLSQAQWQAYLARRQYEYRINFFAKNG